MSYVRPYRIACATSKRMGGVTGTTCTLEKVLNPMS